MTTLTLQEITNEIGAVLGIYNRDTDTWSSDTQPSESDIKAAVNFEYRDGAFLFFVKEFPTFFEKEAYFDSWIESSTVNASTTGTTLVINTAVFKNSMADQQLYVYNETQDESVYITEYSSTTQVTVSADISDWASGDTIYILGREFSFGGDGVDHWTTTEVAVKYTSSDTRYRPATKVEKHHIYISGYEDGNKYSPEWYDTSLLVSDVLKNGVGIFPRMDTKISKAIRVTRTAQPVAMTDNDTPRIPVSKPLIYAGLAWAKRYRGGDEFVDNRDYETLYKNSLAEAAMSWRPDRSDAPKTVRQSQRSIRRRQAYR